MGALWLLWRSPRIGGGAGESRVGCPGPRSFEGLEWLARVGASPLEPWGHVMGWGRALTYDHARRLAAAGLVRTVRMTQGDGSLFVATAAGAARVGYPASCVVRSIGPSNWSHATACACMSAWLQLRGHSWWSDRESAGARSGYGPCATPTIAEQRELRVVRISLAGLLYVCDRVDIADAVRRAAWDAGIAEGPFLSV